MKTKLTLLSAFSIVALMACQREATVVAPVNPTYNPDDNTVLTKLVLNVSSASGATKQTAEAVQAGGNAFRGMQDVHLLTFSIPDDKHGPKGDDDFFWYTLPSGATKDYDLGNMLAPNSIVTTEDGTNGTRILELALPLETNAILLYGRATRTGIDADEKLGVVESSGTTVDNVVFSLKNRMNGKKDLFDLFGDMMGRILTGIMNTGLEVHTPARGYKESDTKDGRFSFWWPIDSYSSGETATLKEIADANATDEYSKLSVKAGEHYPDGFTIYNGSTGIRYTMHYGSIRWSELGKNYKEKKIMSALEEVMGEAYANIMTLSTKGSMKELRAASSAAVLRLTQDLYSILLRVMTATTTNANERIAQLLAIEVVNRAKNFYAVDNDGKVSYQSRATILQNVINFIPNAKDYSSITDDFFYREGVTPKQLGFPINLGLPVGSAIMSFMNPHEVDPDTPGLPDYDVVVYEDAIPSYGIGGNSFPVDNYRYPAELMYYTNSGIHTSPDTKDKATDYPQYTEGWSLPGSWTEWKGPKHVESSTRSVAVAKTINYGTALLSTRVAYSAATIQDNNKGLHPSENPNSIAVGTKEKQFEITGIMISGVCDQVGWNFLPKNNTFAYMIYDDLSYDDPDGGGIFIPKYSTNENSRYTNDLYTLTFDNYDSGKTLEQEQNKVYVALELVNRTGQDLWGELNLIRKDGTFYLVGELDPSTDESKGRFPKKGDEIDLSREDFNYPPFDVYGNTLNVPRVFMQDYVTNLTLRFTSSSLSKAYLTVPDLRSGQVSLGLSVDLTWQKGYDFDVALGGVQ